MNYLGPLRLHFFGRFQAAVSTVNNTPNWFENATFDPEYQELDYEGSWNPRGDADWRLMGCSVASAWHADGSPASPEDPILTCTVADSDRAAPAKLVDLDSEQQMVSTIWGLEMRICDASGATLVRAGFEPAAFTDLWHRSVASGEDMTLGAMFQSTLSDLEWTDEGVSPFLTELREAAGDGLLSVKFNVDGYDTTFDSPDFTTGRIAGTIGPADATAPRHFTPGRHFLSAASPMSSPKGRLNNCTAVVDDAAGKVHLDLGNAFPTASPGGPPDPSIGSPMLVCQAPSDTLHIGELPAMDDDWYAATAGVVTLPAEGSLSPTDLERIAGNPLALVPSSGGEPIIAEPANGLYVRMDSFVFRLDPGDTATVRLFATRFGAPYPGATVALSADARMLQGGDGSPPVATPAQAIQFPSQVQTGVDGWATFTITAADPGCPRGYIDGQVYGVRPLLADTVGTDYPVDVWDFVSVLVFSGWKPDEPPTWWGSIQPILQQYANLYPIMDRFVDLADYESVSAYRLQLLLAFGLDVTDPNSMPVTRDLSGAKRRAIVKWLTEVGPDGKPLLGTPPPPAERAEAVRAARPTERPVRQLGKTEAFSRRVGRSPGE